VGVETELKNWMIKNKDWCSIPDQVIANMQESFAKTPVFAQRACKAAEMIKRGVQPGAGQVQAQPAIKLPTGPL